MRSGSRATLTSVLGIQWAILLSVIGLLVLAVNYLVDADYLVYPLCVFLCALFIWSVWSWKTISGKMVDPYMLFLLAMIVFNGGQVILELFHLNKNGLLNDVFPAHLMVVTLLITALGFCGMHLGALTASVSSPERRIPKIIDSARECRLIGWILLAISFVPLLLFLKSSAQTVMSMGYMGLYQTDTTSGVASIPRVLSVFVAPGICFILVGSRRIRINRWICVIVATIYVLGNLMVGNRGESTMLFAAFGWLWHRTIKPLPGKRIVVVSLILILVVLPFVGATRTLSGKERFSPQAMIERCMSRENLGLQIITEMGNTLRIVAYALDMVPSKRSMDYGKEYVSSLLTLIPGAYWASEQTYSSWLVWQVAPAFAAKGGGLGFSVIAEAYMNFGWPGVFIVLWILGYAIARLAFWAEKVDDPARLALVASVLAFLLIYPRGTAAGQYGRWVWCALAPFCAVGAARLLAAVSRSQATNTQCRS